MKPARPAGNARIAGCLRAARQAVGVTQERLAAALGVRNEAVSRWECGRDVIAAWRLAAIAAALDLPIEIFFGAPSVHSLEVAALAARIEALPRATRAAIERVVEAAEGIIAAARTDAAPRRTGEEGTAA